MPSKPKTTQPKTPDISQNRDLFETPNYAVDLLIPFISKDVKCVWECACGNGKITKRLEKSGIAVYATDIRFNPDIVDCTWNFLQEETRFPDPSLYTLRNTAIITNPPFSLKKEFYEKCKEYGVPFALLIPADYSRWIIDAIRYDGAEKIIPERRINYITPTGKSQVTGHTSYFHSMWLTRGFNLGRTETFVDLSLKEMKENI